MKKYLILVAVIFTLTACSKTSNTTTKSLLGKWYVDSTQYQTYISNTLSSNGTLSFNHSNPLIYNYISDNSGALTEPPSATPRGLTILINFTYTESGDFIYNKYETGEIDTLQIIKNTTSNLVFKIKKHAPDLVITTNYCTK